ncbi:MAG: 50S ribosomal protein L1 [Bacteroidota bacterium]
MAKRKTKREKKLLLSHDFGKAYFLQEGVNLLKKSTNVKFDASVDIHVNLNINPQKADQIVRGVVDLPHGTGKARRVLVICTPDKEEEVKKAGADYAGCDEYLKKLENKWKEVDVIVAIPILMAKVGKVGKIIGPMGLMPSPKNGTVTPDPAKAVREIKAGKIEIKNDEYGQIHASIGRVSFSNEKLEDNINEVISTIKKLKPSSSKGGYIQSITLASTMGKGIKIDQSSIK